MAKLVSVEIKVCRQVCRKWKRLIHSPDFMNLWKPSPTLLLRVRTLDKKLAARWRLMRDKDHESALDDGVAEKRITIIDQAWHQGCVSNLRSPMFPADKNIRIHASAKGLVFFSTRYTSHFYVCNPLTGALKELPEPPDCQWDFSRENVQMSVKEGTGTYTIAIFYHDRWFTKTLVWYKSDSGKWNVDRRDFMKVKGTLTASDTSSFLVGYLADRSKLVTAAYNRVWHAVVTPLTKLPPPTKGAGWFPALWYTTSPCKFKFFSFNGCFKLAIGYEDELVLCHLDMEQGVWEEEFRCELQSYNPNEVPSLLVEGCLLVAYYKYNGSYHGLAPLVIFNLETRDVQPLQNNESHGKRLRKDMELLSIFTPTSLSIP